MIYKQVSVPRLEDQRNLVSPKLGKGGDLLGKGDNLPASLASFFAYLALFAVVAFVIGFMAMNAMAEQAVTSAQQECEKYDYCAEYAELAVV